jgi:hypothetical protein
MIIPPSPLSKLNKTMTNDLTRIVYLFDKHNAKGGVTIAYRPMIYDSKGFPQGIFAEVAVAYCNPKDTFSRKVGRELAEAMLAEGKSIKLPVYTYNAPVRYLKGVFAQYMTSKIYP